MEFGGGFTQPTPGLGSAGFVMCRWQKTSTRNAVSSDSLRLMFDSNAIGSKFCPSVTGW